MTSDELLALLSMDSYNRVYGTGVTAVTGDLSAAHYVELEDLGISRGTLADWKAVGFFAAAYKIAGTGTDLDGKTVIAYRGTDSLGRDAAVVGGSDVWNGWFIGAGAASGPQARFAFEFYQAVAMADAGFNGDWRTAKIEVTGHSLRRRLGRLAA